MIEPLARKRTNLVALAALFALVAAMFTALPSASAIDLGECLGTSVGTNYLALGDSCVIEDSRTNLGAELTVSASGIVRLSGGGSYGDINANPPGDPDVFTIEANADTVVTANAIGKVTLTNDQNTDSESDDLMYKFEVIPAASVEITFDDSDNTVQAGTDVTVTVIAKAVDRSGDSFPVVLSVPSTGLYFFDDQENADPTDDTSSQRTGFALTLGAVAEPRSAMLSTTGAPAGDYVVTASYPAQGNIVTAGTSTATLTVGNPGVGLASAALAPANVKDGAPSTDAGATPDKTTKRAGSTIYLAVTASNSLGARANPADVDQVTVIAAGATVGDDANENHEDSIKTFVEEERVAGDEVGALQVFAVSSDTPGTITVRATVIGPSGSQSTESLDLVFTGDAETISLGEPNDRLGQNGDEIEIEVTAVDAGGNAAHLDAASITASIVNAEGNPAANLSVSDAQKVDDKGTADDESDDETIATAVIVTVSSTDVANVKADRGVYTLKVRLNNDAETEQSVDVTVVGATDAIELAADPAGGANFGDIITVTATLTDEDGNPVADGTTVDFSVTPGTGLAHIGASADDVETKDGAATSKYAVVGEGVSVVSAVADDSGVSGVVVIMSSVGRAEEMEAGPRLSDLSGTFGLVSYSGPDTTASALSALLAGRASAIWRSNNGSWGLYANVNGAIVPGSSDFTVTSGDVLYLGN